MHYKEAKSILSSKNGMNIYRGCTHGCIYCDSRSKCYNFDHKFEDIEVKKNAPELLEKALKSKRNKCMISTGAMTDPYLHLEAEIGYTRKCLELIDKYGFGVCLLTKSDLILRDLDLIKSINSKSKCVVQISLSTYDEDLCKIIEPNVATTKERIEVLKIMRDNGIPTIVWLMPFLPDLTDDYDNIKNLLDCCIDAGVHGILSFGFGFTMRDGSRDYLYKKLDEHFPSLRQEYEKRYGGDYIIQSKNEKELTKLFNDTCKKHNILHTPKDIFGFLQKFEEKHSFEQISLF